MPSKKIITQFPEKKSFSYSTIHKCGEKSIIKNIHSETFFPLFPLNFISFPFFLLHEKIFQGNKMNDAIEMNAIGQVVLVML